MTTDEQFMQRCFDLARLGAGGVLTNPMVGAVIVHDGYIIGEGFHQKYGEAHAEVNAVNSVPDHLKHLLPFSTIYVSLEPCCFYGKTPACTDLILKSKIPKVVVSALDATPNVNGKGIRLLREHGVEVVTGILKEQGEAVVKFRTTIVQKNRPYIILKYAQSQDGFIGKENEQVWLTHPLSKRLVHKWRSEVDGILVGTNTALVDNPQLNNRLYFGKSPIRMVLDRTNKLSKTAHLLDDSLATIVFSEQSSTTSYEETQFIKIPFDDTFFTHFFEQLLAEKIGVLLVEGGAKLLQSFINKGYWDEARVFKTSNKLIDGIKAPALTGNLKNIKSILNDELFIYYND